MYTYAYICGSWVPLYEDPNCEIEHEPLEKALVLLLSASLEFLTINFKGDEFKIHKSFIQISSREFSTDASLWEIN